MRLPFAFASAVIAAPLAAQAPVPSPGELIANAPASDWKAIRPSDLLVMDLAPDTAGTARRVVIQLIPAPFSQGWIGNIRKLAGARWWDGLAVNRVQENYVVQWGDPEAENKAKAKPLPPGLATIPQSAYTVPNFHGRGGVLPEDAATAHRQPDPYGAIGEHVSGWPVGYGGKNEGWPLHCYGAVGVGRDMPPDTGSGAELYTVIGHAPRHLDRNIAVVGRIIEGIEHLSTLPRGTGPLGFYEKPEQRTVIRSIRIGTDVGDLPAYQYLSTSSSSFAAFVEARRNRRDAFFIRPAGGADICNLPVPVRRAQ